MRRINWKSFELKRMGLHSKTVKAIMRLQRNQIYADKKQELLKIKILEVLLSANIGRLMND